MVTRVEKSPPPAPPGADDQVGDFTTLDAIATEGAGLDAPPAADVRQEQQVLASEAEELAEALGLLRAAALPFAPDHVQEPLLQVWNDKQLVEIGKAIVAVARKHGLTLGQLFEGYGPYIQLMMALGMPALATLKLLRVSPPPVERVDGQQQPS
ncbi:hypothetical protein [Hydrogenophaga laconesensis]|uniref:Uncharacterized protein n=1 Tax=Hydrogenophaga laconesensis TaxID=1805971 RepID=A0ABU1VE06_9BURK|nr:hypothetical protein [Hydrogenophaga laconesensis]MDR7095540.1 hypothetical protein [Hydrogenophaga laconesensis]